MMPNSELKDEDYVLLETFDNVGSAQITKALLESGELFCIISGEESINFQPVFSRKNSGIKLFVHKEDEERASQILESTRTQEELAIACPECGSTDITTKAPKPGFANGMASFFKSVFGGKNMVLLHCNSCGEDFE